LREKDEKGEVEEKERRRHGVVVTWDEDEMRTCETSKEFESRWDEIGIENQSKTCTALHRGELRLSMWRDHDRGRV